MLFVGILIAIIIIVPAILLGGSSLLFLNAPSVICVVGISLALILATHGGKGLGIVFRAPFVDFLEDKKKGIEVYKDLKLYLIISGWIGFLIGVIFILGGNYGELNEWVPGFAVALVTVFYGYSLAYIICHPILRRLEQSLEE